MQTALMDMEFEKLRDKLSNEILNTTAAREHVGEIERKIRVVKERARSTISILPYKLLLKRVIIKLMHFCVMWMNSFPVKLGISEKIELQRNSVETQARCKDALKSTFWGIL